MDIEIRNLLMMIPNTMNVTDEYALNRILQIETEISVLLNWPINKLLPLKGGSKVIKKKRRTRYIKTGRKNRRFKRKESRKKRKKRKTKRKKRKTKRKKHKTRRKR